MNKLRALYIVSPDPTRMVTFLSTTLTDEYVLQYLTNYALA